MNPHQRNKIDINSLSSEEQKLFRLYGKLPNKKDLLQNKLKERKYFDSGDYALSKAGKASDAGVTQIGSQHPNPENIPHLTSPTNGNGVGNGHIGPAGLVHQGSSPVKESSFLHRETSVNDQDQDQDSLSPSRLSRRTNSLEQDQDREQDKAGPDMSVSPPPVTEGVPIRQPQQ